MEVKGAWEELVAELSGTSGWHLEGRATYFVRHHVGRKVRSSMHRVGDADELHDEELQEEIPIEY